MFNQSLIQALGQRETPFYFYDLGVLRTTLESARNEAGKSGYHLHYALKANSNERILRLISDDGFGADCVSGNEIRKAVETGFQPGKIVFSGVGKSDKEITLALENRISCFNVESVGEMEVINAIAGRMGVRANIALRVNPNIHAHTHKYITTGLEENKFGINPWDFEQAIEKLNQSDHLDYAGLHFHIGSQITDLSAFKNLCHRVNEINRWFIDQHFTPTVLNLGGGLGVNYQQPDQFLIPDFQSYFQVFRDFLEVHPGQALHLEPGRSLVAQCGNLITKVLFVKKGINVDFVICDAGMTELLRPALYQAYHKIENLTATEEKFGNYDVVGPVCESSDCFGKMVTLPLTRRGDLIAIRTAGAYGETMASRYNLRDLVTSVYSDQL